VATQEQEDEAYSTLQQVAAGAVLLYLCESPLDLLKMEYIVSLGRGADIVVLGAAPFVIDYVKKLV